MNTFFVSFILVALELTLCSAQHQNSGKLDNQWTPSENFPSGGSYEWHFEAYLPNQDAPTPKGKKINTEHEHKVEGESSFYSKNEASYEIPNPNISFENKASHQPIQEQNTKYAMNTQISMSEYESEEEPELNDETNPGPREELFEFPSTSTTTAATTVTTTRARPSRRPMKRISSSAAPSTKKTALKNNAKHVSKIAASTKKTSRVNDIMPVKTRLKTTLKPALSTKSSTQKQAKNKLAASMNRRQRIRTTTANPGIDQKSTPNTAKNYQKKRKTLPQPDLVKERTDIVEYDIEEQELIPFKPPSGDFGIRIKKVHSVDKRQVRSPTFQPLGRVTSRVSHMLHFCTDPNMKIFCQSHFAEEQQKQSSNLIDNRHEAASFARATILPSFQSNMFLNEVPQGSVSSMNINHNGRDQFVPFHDNVFQESSNHFILYRGDVINHFSSKYSLV